MGKFIYPESYGMDVNILREMAEILQPNAEKITICTKGNECFLKCKVGNKIYGYFVVGVKVFQTSSNFDANDIAFKFRRSGTITLLPAHMVNFTAFNDIKSVGFFGSYRKAEKFASKLKKERGYKCSVTFPV